MRRTLALVALAVAAAIGSSALRAQELEPATEPAPEIVWEQESQGALPNLEGRWLTLVDIEGQAGTTRTVAHFWDLRRTDGGYELIEPFVNLPDDLHASMQTLGNMGQSWRPTDEDLARIDEGWAELPDSERGITHARNELWGPDAFTDEIKREAKTKDALFVLRQTYAFLPKKIYPVRHVNVFGALAKEDGGYTGSYTGLAVAMGMVAIPIPFSGTFKMIPIGEREPPSPLERLAELFSGCGR